MFCLSNNGIIRLTRGDSIEFPFIPAEGNSLSYSTYHMSAKDELYFGVMEANEFFEDAIIKKKYTSIHQNEDGSIYIEFEPTDTEYLLPGLYYYQIKMRLYNEYNDSYSVNTVCPKTQFWIEE